ncbi:MAG: serine hydrolase [Bacteroidota bacterium]
MKKTITLILLLSLVAACRPIRFAQFYLSENHQKPKFDEQIIQHDPENTFQFKQGEARLDSLISNIDFYVPEYKQKKFPRRMPLHQYLDEGTRTSAFLVIRNDSLIYESYFDNFNEYSQLPSFSVAKSFTSALVGIAVEEGFIASIHDPVTKYIEEVRDKAPEWQQLTVEHLLNMRSGIDFNEDNYVNPYSSIADLYLKNSVLKVIQKAKFEHPPGTVEYYSSMDTQILGLIVQRATGKTLAAYMEEKIWRPIGMESDARWFSDKEKYGVTKAFCCLHPIARDYAKFARLYLNQGNWEGQQIVPKDWVSRSIQPDFKNGCYQYQWYSGDKSYVRAKNEAGKWTTKTFPDSLSAAQAITEPDYQFVRKRNKEWVIRTCGPAYYALGIFGQEVHIFPEENLIIIRLGERWDTPTRNIIYQIRKALNPTAYDY